MHHGAHNEQCHVTYRESLEATRSDIEDVLKSLNVLLEIAQAESGHFRGQMQSLKLVELVIQLAEMYGDVFDEQGQRLDVNIEPGICMQGNRQLLGQLISNRLENAHQYAGNKAQVILQLRRDGAGDNVRIG